MPHFRVFPSQYAPFEIKADTDHWNDLTYTSQALIARLINGDYSVLSDGEAAGGVIVNKEDGQQLRVAEIDTTAKSLTVTDLSRSSRRSMRRR
ncbi:MAG TPA: hypothetical protein VKP65_19250 [Rhodothermales bacterium]|nr:hypothetical protein [Rhodothermales bacterium]